MCGRYGFVGDAEKINRRFDIEKADIELRDNYNVAPTQEMPVIERHSPNKLVLRKWGIQPSWSNMFLINAQSEKLPFSNIWKRAFLESRCIVPASYFFEWQKATDGKQPYLIRLKNKEMMGFAGIVVSYKDKNGTDQEGYVIITTTPNSLMEKIHNRMPVILKKSDEDDWLNPDITEYSQLEKMLNPYDATEMEAYPVSSLVNSPKNNNPVIIKPLKI